MVVTRAERPLSDAERKLMLKSAASGVAPEPPFVKVVHRAAANFQIAKAPWARPKCRD